MRFVKVSFESELEAKNRAVLLALKTCNYLRSVNSFVRFYTDVQLQDFTKAESQLISLFKFYKLQRSTYLQPLNSFCAKNFHDGIIIKRQEPYRTILRARPKQIKNRFERFIALGDSDQAEVQRRVNEVVKSNNRKRNIKVER